MILEVRGMKPEMGQDCFLAPNATVVGDVKMGRECSVWFNAVVRGDVNSIRVGNRVNIQDCAVLHTTYKKSTLVLGNNVSIGHSAVVHGCTIHDNVLVGIGATVLDHAVVHENSIIAAGAVVLEGTVVEPNSIYAGVPAKRVKTIEPEQTRDMIQRISKNYTLYASWFQEKTP